MSGDGAISQASPSVAECAGTRPLRIGFFGNIGSGNLGDDACLVATFQFLRERVPHAQFHVFTSNDIDTRARHGVEVFPSTRDGFSNAGWSAPTTRIAPAAPPAESGLKGTIKKLPLLWPTLKYIQSLLARVHAVLGEVAYIARAARYIRQLDWIGATGGGQLADNFTGPWGYPYNMLRWSLLGRLLGKRVFYVSVGAATLKYGLSKLMGRIAFNLAHHRSFRDETSRNIARDIGIARDDGLSPDMVFAIDPKPFIRGAVVANPKLVAINIFPHGDVRYWPDDRPEAYRHYLTVMRDFCLWLLREGYEVLFFPSQVRADPRCIADLVAMLDAAGARAQFGDRIHAPRILSFEDFFTALAPAQFVVCTRFHGMIMSFILGKPVLAIPNQPKMVDLMNSMDLGQYALHIETVSADKLKDAFTAMRADRERIVSIVNDNVARKRAQVLAQFEAAFVSTAAVSHV